MGVPPYYSPGDPKQSNNSDNVEQQRLIKHHLAVFRHVDEVIGNVAANCRCCRISRQ
jgi:hypothetical protein